MKDSVDKSCLTIKNMFLKVISDKFELNNWVDIEQEYYKQLLSIAHLNIDFQKIKDLLVDYLKKISANQIDMKEGISEKIYSKIKLQDLSAKGVDAFVNEKIAEHELCQQILDAKQFSWNDYPVEISDFPDWEKTYDTITRTTRRPLFEKEKNLQDKIRDVLQEKYSVPKCVFITYPKKTLFLNFNYTNTDRSYIDAQKPNLFNNERHDFSKYYGITKESIHIHGELDNPDNPIIFGYGDELGEEYATIEKLNDNNYLENVKSVRYSEKDNYKRLLEFINADFYQVFIFGHSCGISDRTLLNTLFEHDNCVSIKPFYHKETDGTDNYSDLTRNISRNFTDKRQMREKVVNKTCCEPLC